MSRINCFDNNPVLKAKVTALMKRGVSEDKAIKEIVISEYERLHAEMNLIRKSASITPIPYTSESSKKYTLDGATINTYVAPSGKKILFAASSVDSVKVLKGGDLDEILKSLSEKVTLEKAKENIKNTIIQSISSSLPIEQPKKGGTLFERLGAKKESTPISKGRTLFDKIKPAKIEVSNAEELDMKAQMDTLEDDVPLRKRIEEEIKKFEGEDWKEVEKWLKANFPNLPVYRVKNIIKATNGQQAWGMLKDGAIYVYENAEVGTIYHEVFEGVWKAFTSPEEQSSINSEFRSRKGTFIDRPTGKTINYSDATDLEVKEQLAEEFRDYILYKKYPMKTSMSFIGKLFHDIVNFIKSFFTGKDALSNTEKLFNKIGKGYYKNFLPSESPLSFAKKGIIDIEEVYASAYSEFRIEKIPANVVHDIMQQMTYITLTDLIKTNKSLFSIPKINRTELYNKLKIDLEKTALKSRKEAEESVRLGNITQEEAQNKIDDSIVLWKSIRDEWDSIKDKHEEYLKVYSIEFDENDDVILTDDDRSGKSDWQDTTKLDTFKKANSAIKLLLSTIPIVNNEGKFVPSSINGATLLPTSQAFMAIMNNTHTSRDIDEMLERIKEMSEEDNNYVTLYKRLTKGEEVHDIQLLTALWKTFKKQNPDVKNVYLFENGEVEVGDSNLSSAARQVQSEYVNNIISNIKDKKNPYFEYSEKQRVYVGNSDKVKKIKFSTIDDKISFLKSLGIVFTKEELVKSKKMDSFITAVNGIKKSIEDQEKIVTINGKMLGIKGRLMSLSLIRASIDNPEFGSTFFNVKGERTQTFIGTNVVSDLYDAVSQIENKNELTGTPFEYLLKDVFSEGSVILDKMFNPTTGNRISQSEDLMKPGYVDGTINLSNGKKKQSSKLTYKERLIQEINLNLSGYYYNLVPGDASIEWMINMDNHITPKALLSGMSETNDIFKQYFLSEVKLSREGRKVSKGRDNRDLRFFKGILGEELHKQIILEKGAPEDIYEKHESKINKALLGYINNEVSETKSLLLNYGIIESTPEGYVSETINFKEKDSLTEDSLNRQLTALSINYMINNIEMHKLVYSDPYQYSDELKRIKSASSPRQSIIHSSPDFNAKLNKAWNKDYSEEDLGYVDMTRDYFRSITIEDVISSSDLKDYGTFEETDGGGVITQSAYRNLRIRAGDWNDREELQYKYDVAYEKFHKGIELSSKEEVMFANGNPGVKSAYTPLKPIVFGNKKNDNSFNDIVLDKFALYPLSFRVLSEINPNSNIVSLYNKMKKEDVDYGVFSTGRKVGGDVKNKLYDKNGDFINFPYTGIIDIPFSILSIQSEVPSKEEASTTRGSQITKLATLDYMEAGVPIDYKSGEWNSLKEEDKLKASPLYAEMKKNQTLLEEMTREGYLSLLKKLGISEDADGNFIIEDFEKAANTIKSEVLKREVNDNISDALVGFANGDVILEATPAYQQVRNILYSIADKQVIKPKISGGQKVQIPSTLFEENRISSEKGAFTSDVLSFYEDKDGKRVAEVMIGRWFDTTMSDAELLDYLNNTEEGGKILQGIGFRIPTQKQNSIDAFKIKKFLPKEFGDSVVIPSALVKKVGSDFDIDKLYMYFKNVYEDLKGNIKLVPFVGYGEKAKEKLSNMYDEGHFLKEKDRDIINKWIKNRKEEDKQDVTNTLATAIFGEDAYDQEVIDDYLSYQTTKALKDGIIDAVYKQSLQNEYIQSLQNLVSHPLNFENLIKPNSADQLKALSKAITEKRGDEIFDYKDVDNMLSRKFMSSLRSAFVTGKYAIGIAAVNQTNHSLNQRAPIYIDMDKWELLSQEDKYWLSGGTNKKEDVKITFKDYNKIEAGGKMVPTLSMIKNAKGENISDIIGQFIDGYVDISKGPWIMELGATPNVSSVFLFLVKIGVPIEDVSYFINQPIIRDYLEKVESAGYSWLFIDDFVKELQESPKYATANSQVKKITTIPSGKTLFASIGKSEFSPKEKAEQQFFLNEFLKYAKLANHMFLVTQGSNFDTANFNDSSLVFKKHQQYLKSLNTLISSTDKLLKNSFVGDLRNTIYNVTDAFSTILKSDQPDVRAVLQEVLTPYIDYSDRDFVKISQKAVSDLFDWAVQVDRKLNTQVRNILISDDNAAKEINDFVNLVKSNEKHPLYNNQVINLISPHFSQQKEGGVNNIKIKNKDNKVYDQNQMIYAFHEMKTYLNGENSELYGKLVRLAVLQSGLTGSPISFTSILPHEDFKEIYNKTLSTLETFPNLQEFAALNVFQRNNWHNDDLVPTLKAKWSKKGKYNNNMKLYGEKRAQQAILDGEIPPLVKINILSTGSDSDVIVYKWEVGTKAEKLAKKKVGDYSYIQKGLFKKVYKGDAPLTVSFNTGEFVITEYIYKAINAWGESKRSDGIYFSANEFYTTGRPSVIDNGFIKVEEVDDASILTYFGKKAPIKKEGTDEIPNCS